MSAFARRGTTRRGRGRRRDGRARRGCCGRRPRCASPARTGASPPSAPRAPSVNAGATPAARIAIGTSTGDSTSVAASSVPSMTVSRTVGSRCRSAYARASSDSGVATSRAFREGSGPYGSTASRSAAVASETPSACQRAASSRRCRKCGIALLSACPSGEPAVQRRILEQRAEHERRLALRRPPRGHAAERVADHVRRPTRAQRRECVVRVVRDQVCARGPRRRAVPAEVRAHDLVPRDRVTQPRVGRAAARDSVQEQDRHDAARRRVCLHERQGHATAVRDVTRRLTTEVARTSRAQEPS